MKLYTFKRQQIIHRPADEVFSFFENPENLAVITPPKMAFNILTPGPINMREGLIIDYTVRVMGMRTFWRTLISDYDPPRRFLDIQLKGPYVYWHHTHTFIEQDDETVIGDEIRYILPFGPIGRLAHALLVERQLKQIFAFRAESIRRQFSRVSD